jgi:hypothetical protein
VSSELIRAYLPHAPSLGLWLAPEIPPDKLRAAVGDYGRDVDAGTVLALYDGTRLGSAKDGILFLPDRLVKQTTDLEAPRAIPYSLVVGVRVRRRLLGGRRVEVEVGRGRTTVTETLDFSVHPGAAAHVERLLEHLMLAPPAPAAPGSTDVAAVVAALDRLAGEGRLSESDRLRLLEALGQA